MALTTAVLKIHKLYTQPEEVAYAYKELGKVGKMFTVAAAFGNVHGVYKPGNVELRPEILKNSQDYIQKELKTGRKAGLFCIPWRQRFTTKPDTRSDRLWCH